MPDSKEMDELMELVGFVSKTNKFLMMLPELEGEAADLLEQGQRVEKMLNRIIKRLKQ